MKSEDVILQELERERQERLAAEEGPAAAAAASAANEKSTKFMISGEAPVLMSKACELMIKDLSFRAWRHTERNRRRTLQKQDLHASVGESEVYDFLIDIVPRVTATATTTQRVQHSQPSHLPASATVMAPPSAGMQQVVGGVSVGHPTAVSQPTSTQAGIGVIDNTQIMQMMGTVQHQAQQPQQTNQFHQDPSQQQPQQQAPGMQSQPGPHNLHQQVLQQPQHLQQTFATMPPIDGAQLGISLSTGQPAGGAPGTMQTVGTGSTLDTNFTTTTTIPQPAAQSEATSSLQVPHNWPAVNQPES